MKFIEKKISKEYFDQVLSGQKKYELRLNDFDIEEGDVLVLKECGNDGSFTGREISKDVSLVRDIDIKKWHYNVDDVLEKGIKIISFK